jgi:CDP-glucose 4,6-dehydratase
MIHLIGDICDYDSLKAVIDHYQPDIIFHLAAQAIVLDSYKYPQRTFEVNAQGTVNVLEASRSAAKLQAVVLVTTDKCYENREWTWGYRENDPLGGNDPYSASKAMAELAIASYRKSFFAENGPAIASVRAGNVIGGGDFSPHRIVPDCMKALMQEKPILVRNPQSIRPWFHVLDPLSGYLTLGALLLQDKKHFSESWNFGPKENRGVTVRELVEKSIELWGQGSWVTPSGVPSKAEMNFLRLNWDKAAQELFWEPTYGWIEALESTVDWFKAYLSDEDIYSVSRHQIENYMAKASSQGLKWAKALEEAVREV